MAGKRKPVEVIQVDATSREVKSQLPPSCYNARCSYCRSEMCGEWFSTCKEGENDDHAG